MPLNYEVLTNSQKCGKDKVKRRFNKDSEGNTRYYYTVDEEGNKIFCHSPETWKNLHNEQVMSRNRKGRLKYKRIGKLSEETYEKNTQGKIRRQGRHEECQRGLGRYVYSDRIGKVHQTKCVTYEEYLNQVHRTMGLSNSLTPSSRINNTYSRTIKTPSRSHKLHRRRGPVSRKRSAIEESLVGLAGLGFVN